MLYHLTLVARPFIDTGRTGDTWWWLTQTPLKVVTAGTEAVLVFFVLSGLVVALPAARDGFRWRAYYPSRMVRIYLPVMASIALAVVLIWLAPRTLDAVTPDSWVVRGSARTLDWSRILAEASLWPASYDYNNVLWSLRWEVIFSLALPLFIVVARAMRRRWHLAAMVSVAAMIVGRIAHVDALVYLPVFLLGTLMAVKLDDLRDWGRERSRGAWIIATALSLSLLVASWMLRPLEHGVTGEVLWALSGVGAAGIVLVAVCSPAVEAMLSTRLLRWLGRISFSLYLVQAPIIATLAFTLGDERWPFIIALGIPACIVVAWGFFVVVERPSHRLARVIARRCGARSGQNAEDVAGRIGEPRDVRTVA